MERKLFDIKFACSFGVTVMNAEAPVYVIPKLLIRNAEKWADKVAMRKKDRGIWQEYTWGDVYEKVKYLSLGFMALGLGKGDKVTFIGDNEPELEWGILAVQSTGGLTAGAYPDAIPPELRYIAEHSDSKFAIANDQEQCDKFIQLKNELPQLKKVIYWDPKGLVHYDDPLLMGYDELMELGRKYEQEHPSAFEDSVASIEPEDFCALYYTSGTSGLPKGAVMSHRNLIKFGEGTVHKCGVTSDYNFLSVASSAFIGSSFVSTIPCLLTGGTLNYPEEVETLVRDTREVGPQLLANTPRNWEAMVAITEMRVMDAGFLKRLFYQLFLPVGFKRAELSYTKQRPNLFWRLLTWLAEATLFRQLKDRHGLLNARVAITGSAAMSADTFRFWRSMGISLRQMYAGTEAGYISGHDTDDIKDDTVGTLVPGVEARVSHNGELLTRSESMFRGYYKDPEKTKASIEDGWFHTGDAAHIAEDGHVIYLDRVADLAEMTSGERYAPGYIEGRLRYSPYLKDAIVLGAKRDFVSAIIIIKYDNVGRWAEKNHLSYTTFADLSQKEEIAGLIRKDIDRVNKNLPEIAKIRKYVLLHKEFDPDEAELTRTQKLRRSFVEQRYSPIVDAIYSNKEEVMVEAPVTYQDGRKGVMKTVLKIRSCA